MCFFEQVADFVRKFEVYVNRRAFGVFTIIELRLGKGGLPQLVRAPVYGFFAPVYVSIFYKFPEYLNDTRLVEGVEGQIGMVPIPHYSQ